MRRSTGRAPEARHRPSVAAERLKIAETLPNNTQKHLRRKTFPKKTNFANVLRLGKIVDFPRFVISMVLGFGIISRFPPSSMKYK